MEVTRKNFDTEIHSLLASLQKSDFVAIDLEFTGLPKDQPTVTDTPMEVYYKAMNCANHNNIIQLGITNFVPSAAGHDAHSYCIYIFPSTYNGKVNQKITLDVSSIEFNREAGGVDFGKWITEGVPYYNRKLQIQLHRCFENDRAIEINTTFKESPGSDSAPEELTESKEGGAKTPKPKAGDTYENPVRLYKEEERQAAAAEFARFKKWTEVYEVGKTYEYVSPKGVFRQHFWNEIRNRFGGELANVIIEEKSTETNYNMLFTMATEDDKQQYLRNLTIDLEKRYQEQLGLSKYWEKMVQVINDRRIPVVFHQGMLDCMYIHSHFENWCPMNFAEFKKSFRGMFPIVYDTKNLARQVETDAAHLEGLFTWVASKNSFDPAVKYPIANKDAATHSKTAHNAGWDSYMTGVVFNELRQLIGDISRSENHIALFKNRYFNMSFGEDKNFYLDNAVLVLNPTGDKKDPSKPSIKGQEKRSRREKRDDTSRDRLRSDLNSFFSEIGREGNFTLHRQNEHEVIGNNIYLFLSFDKPLTPEQADQMTGKLKEQYEIKTLQDYHAMVYNNFQQAIYGVKG